MEQETNLDGIPQGMFRVINLAEEIPETELDSIGSTLLTQVRIDIESRSEWLERLESWVGLATQVKESKTFPWPDASNIKFPLLQTAAVQFHARSFPALLGNSTPVRGKVIGSDPSGVKAAKGTRIGTFLSHQVLYDIKGWVDEMDRGLLILPLIGSFYKKTNFNPQTARPKSEMIHPRDFIINYDARDFEHARKTHRLWKTPNEIVELENRNLYRKFEGSDTIEPPKTASPIRDKAQGLNRSGGDDPDALQELYEVHTLLDLDKDGYKEPYIVTLRASDGKIHRITECFNATEVERNQKTGAIIAITPKKYFTPYFFMPDPESKTHGLGFGTIVGPINEAVNSLINQLTDAGTLSNLQGGFLGRGIRLKGGDTRFTPGEWKQANNTGDDLRKGIFPMPTREPSNVLFQLLSLLIDAGKDLTSVQDLMVGKNPGQNQPFSTSQMVMEQGLKVFNGIYKRIYRSMSEEFQLLYEVNSEHMDLERYMEVLDDNGQEVQQAMQEEGPDAVLQFLAGDFNAADMDIVPTAEPDMLAEVEKAAKAESLMMKVQAGLPINPAVVTRRMLEAEGIEDIDELLELPEPQPDPELILKERELDQRDVELSYKASESESVIMLNETKAEALILESEGKGRERMHAEFIAAKKQRTAEFDALTKRLDKKDGDSKETTGKATGATG
jgi:chaperonin GroES